MSYLHNFVHKTNILLIEEKYRVCQHKDTFHCYVYLLRIASITEHARDIVALD